MNRKNVLIDVLGVGKRYGTRRALVSADVRLREGEVLGFVGPNGAGKTTLLKILSGLIRPTEGSGVVLGRPLASTHETLPFVGLMLEHPPFIEHVSGRKNLELLARLRAGVEPERIDEVIEMVGLDPSDKRPTKTYSQGMRQRLALAQAVMERPPLLLLDEPTNGLDPSGIVELRNLIRRLADEEGMGVLLASHLLTEVEALCDRVVLIDEGRIQRTFETHVPVDEVTFVQITLGSVSQVRILAEMGLLGEPVNGDGRTLRVQTSLTVPELVRRLVFARADVEAIQPWRNTLEEVYMKTVGAKHA